MKVISQKELTLVNECNCDVDIEYLKKAMLWYADKPLCTKKKIFISANYPCVAIYNEKVHVHRLLIMYSLNIKKIPKYYEVHHLDGNKLNANENNLSIVPSSYHHSIHNKNKGMSEEHKKAIIESNKRRKGTSGIKKYHIAKEDIEKYLKNQVTVKQLTKKYNCGEMVIYKKINKMKFDKEVE